MAHVVNGRYLDGTASSAMYYIQASKSLYGVLWHEQAWIVNQNFHPMHTEEYFRPDLDNIFMKQLHLTALAWLMPALFPPMTEYMLKCPETEQIPVSFARCQLQLGSDKNPEEPGNSWYSCPFEHFIQSRYGITEPDFGWHVQKKA